MDVVLVATALTRPVLIEGRVMGFRTTLWRDGRLVGHADELRDLRDVDCVLHGARGIANAAEASERSKHSSGESNSERRPTSAPTARP